MSKLNILFVAPLPPPYGGIANWTAMVSRYFDDKRKTDIFYKIIDTSPKKRVTEGRGLFQRIIGGIVSMIKSSNQLNVELKKCRYDCVHITTSGSLGFIRDALLLRILDKKRINTVYHVRFGRIPSLLKADNWENKLLCYNFKLAKNIIVIDESTYKSLEKTEFKGKINYVPNCINLEELPKRNKETEKIVIFTGWIIKEKGISELLEAWNKIEINIRKNWKLELIGPYKKEYLETLDKYLDESISFVGELEHKTALIKLNSGKAFVLPSYTEGFPNSLLEAMALGKIVIATDVGAIPDILSGECGILVKAKDTENLRNALIKIMVEDVDNLSENAAKKVKENYEISKVVQQYSKLWRGNNVI